MHNKKLIVSSTTHSLPRSRAVAHIAFASVFREAVFLIRKCKAGSGSSTVSCYEYSCFRYIEVFRSSASEFSRVARNNDLGNNPYDMEDDGYGRYGGK